jgi:hypothetical protein
LCEKAHHAIFSEIFKERMDFHRDRAEGSHSLSTANLEQVNHEKPSQERPIQIQNTSAVIWEQAQD